MTNSIPRIYTLLADLLQQRTGQQLSSNRHWRIEMALKPILRKHSIPDLDMLATLLSGNSDPALLRECIEAVLNNETCFFRDQAYFALLTGPVLDAMREKRKDKKHLRIWSAACSSGQEAYSIAMGFAENADKWRGWTIDIVGTDISSFALQQAGEACYSQFEIQRGLPVTMMLKYFKQEGEKWRLSEQIKNKVSFFEHNQTQSAAHLGKFDLVLCRNMLMYLTDENKMKVMKELHKSIYSDGYLMLGAAETLIGHTDDFNTSTDFRGMYEVAKSKSETSSIRLSA